MKRVNHDKKMNLKVKGLLKISNILVVILLFGLPSIGFTQVRSNGLPSNTITNENAFFDASTNFNGEVNIGKGLVFPRTDLRTFTFKIGSLDEINFPTAFDGMIVYNVGTGNTLPGQGIVTAVNPGFYYFSNPIGTTTITNGKWVRFLDITEVFNQAVTGAIEKNGTTLATGGQIYDFTVQQISDSIHNLKSHVFERELADLENNINVGFALNSNTEVFYNGQVIPKSQWTGVGTTILHFNLNTRLYDNIIVSR